MLGLTVNNLIVPDTAEKEDVNPSKPSLTKRKPIIGFIVAIMWSLLIDVIWIVNYHRVISFVICFYG